MRLQRFTSYRLVTLVVKTGRYGETARRVLPRVTWSDWNAACFSVDDCVRVVGEDAISRNHVHVLVCLLIPRLHCTATAVFCQFVDVDLAIRQLE